MSGLLTIGEFSRLTHLSVKALRHYDEVRLLRPANVDSSNGYRLYSASQVPTAHLIRRFRELDMPIDHIRAVLEATDPDDRDRVVVRHLARMEAKLEETRSTVASLRELLAGRGWDLEVQEHQIEATPALAVTATVHWDETERWLAAAFAEIGAALAVGDHVATGPEGAAYTDEFFTDHVGQVTAFVPVAGPARGARRVEYLVLPAVDVAVAVHRGPFSEIDATYGSLGTYVAERMIGESGPIRERYFTEGDDPRTEVCWPIRVDRGFGPSRAQRRA